ncbi:Uncharacterised protein [Mycobacterium tuberculosis]|nr:Uncharacterised protein [Mycobacterium tuberculosis]
MSSPLALWNTPSRWMWPSERLKAGSTSLYDQPGLPKAAQPS